MHAYDKLDGSIIGAAYSTLGEGNIAASSPVIQVIKVLRPCLCSLNTDSTSSTDTTIGELGL